MKRLAVLLALLCAWPAQAQTIPYRPQPVSQVGSVYSGNLIRPILTEMDRFLRQVSLSLYGAGVTLTGAPDNASYVVMGANADLTSERTLAATAPVTLTDGGANSTATIALTRSALTKNDETNITLTLNGSPTTSLVDTCRIVPGWQGTLAATRGGTGQGTWTRGDIVRSPSANTLSALAISSTAGTFLRSTGTDPAWSGTHYSDLYGVGDLLFSDASNSVAGLSDIATGNVLLSGGLLTAPAYGKVGLTTHITGILPLANGGTNANLTAVNGGIAYSGAAALALSAAGTSGQYLRSGGAGAPTWDTFDAGDIPTHDHSDDSHGGSALRVNDSTFTVRDESDTTKKIKFQLSPLGTGTTITYRLPAHTLSGSLKLVDEISANHFSAINQFDDGMVWGAVGGASYASIDFSGFTGLREWDVPDADGKIVLGPSGSTPTVGALLYGNGTDSYSLLPVGASGQILTASGAPLPTWSSNASVVDLTRSWATVQTFSDSTFKLTNSKGTLNKTAQFELDGASANADLIISSSQTADHTFTIPDATTTAVGTTEASTITGTKTIDNSVDGTHTLTLKGDSGAAYRFLRFDDTGATGTGFHCDFNTSDLQASNIVLTTPDNSGKLVTETSVSGLSNKTMGVTGNALRFSNASTGVAFTDNGTTSKALRLILSGLTASTNNTISCSATAARDWEFKNCAGTVVITGNEAAPPSTDNLGSVNTTGVTDTVAITHLTSATAVVGFYRVDYEITCTTADASAGTIALDIIATGDGGAQNIRSATLSGTTATLSATNPLRGSLVRYVASGALDYAIRDVTGNMLTAQFAVRIRVSFLG